MTARPGHDNGDSSADRADESHTERFEEVLATFLEHDALDQPLRRQQLIAAHPDLADELASFFANHDLVRQLAEPSRMQSEAGDPAVQEERTPFAGEAERSTTGKFTLATCGLEPLPSWSEDFRTMPRRFGDYELVEEIGRGGMGVVYEARQLSLNRRVAVKTIHAGSLKDESARQRFRSEAEAAAKLQHPNIVQVYDVGQHAGQPFFSMQYIAGQNLAQITQGTPLAPNRAARYVQQISSAVAHAHEHGILHRDLKPSNVLIDAQDQPRVMDFGLAKQLESNSDITLSGQMLGTPPYMSPEQAGARRSEIGPGSDIYSLGAVLYELLTGQPPFRGVSPLETLRQVRECDPKLPRTLNPQVPRDLELICLKCLEKDVRHRYPSARALADDLGRYLAGDPISLTSLGLFERLARTLERGSLDVELRTWRRILRHFAWIVLLAHVVLFALELFRHHAHWFLFAGVRSVEYAGMALVVWLLRRDWYPPQGSAARQLFALWLGYVTGSAVLHLMHPFEGGSLYPQYAILASLGFIMMGSCYWGYCYLIGAIFLALAVFMKWSPATAPLLFGLVWAASLLALARHLSELSHGAEDQYPA